MMSFLRKKQKLFLSSILVLELLFSSALPASAGLFGGGPSIPSASSVFSDMEKRYHLDTGTIQNQGESFNVSDTKQPSPDVTLFFNPSDPKAGEKITAKAFPMYFSNKETSLYYTWYIKHVGCDLTNNPNANAKALCDQDNDGRITVEDWKIEATSILAKNGFDTAEANYGVPTDDNDGYKARFGGDNRVSSPDHCYVNDPTGGKNYELGDTGNIDFTCPNGTSPVCMVGEGQVDPQKTCTTIAPYIDPLTGLLVPGSTDCPPVTFSDTGVCQVSGLPMCDGAGTPICGTGTPRCVADPTTSTACGAALNNCSGGGGGNINTYCKHLFPKIPGHTSGDGTFPVAEEKFWGVNPEDPDTADNGNKDEANIVGLGQTSFTWNYVSGDQVGVAIEGTSMLTTKYNDSSSMIMWAFSKKDCPLSLANGTGSFTRDIKGYSVTMLSADFDLNKCLERNLVDPAQGGQATNLEVILADSSDNPINDESADGSGDVVSVQASVSNAARSVSEILFEWRVELSDNIQFRNGNGFVAADITNDLRNYDLLGSYKGIALDTLRVSLNMKNDGAKLLAGRKLENYLVDGVGYLRFTSKASESFASGVARKGKSDIVAKFTSTGKKISAYKVTAVPGATAMRVGLPNPLLPGLICNDNALDRVACRVVKNEIIGLRVDPAGLSNFKWTINGVSLNCNNGNVSPNCLDDNANEVNFFPVSGDVGDTYTVTLTANDVTSNKVNPNKDKTITLSRSFHVIEPTLNVASSDLTLAWPKFLGQYKDVEGAASVACPNGLCNEFSESVLEGFSGEDITLHGVFVPNFLAAGSTRQWSVDGTIVNEVAPPVVGGEITFKAIKSVPGVYNIALTASVVQSQEIRQALRDIWGISPLDSPEIHFSTGAQVELQEPGFSQGKLEGSKKYLAAIASYIPASVMFSFRILLSIVLMLFTAHFLFTLLPEGIGSPRSEPRKRDE